MWYNVDFKKLTVLLLPLAVRRVKLVNFFNVFMSPIIIIYDNWMIFRSENVFKLNHNAQVCYLRKALNDLFDPQQRRIYIEDGSRFVREYLYTQAELKPKYMGGITLYLNSDYSDTGVDFVVRAPQSVIGTSLDSLIASISFYKLGGKRYKIEPI